MHASILLCRGKSSSLESLRSLNDTQYVMDESKQLQEKNKIPQIVKYMYTI